MNQQLRQMFQFSLRKLFLAMTMVCIFCGLLVWIGYTLVTLIVANTAGTIAGLLVCGILGLGFDFSYLKRDAVKSLIVASATMFYTGAGFKIMAMLQPSMTRGTFTMAGVFVFVSGCIVYWNGLRFSWPELDTTEKGVTSLVSFMVTLALSSAVVQLIVN